MRSPAVKLLSAIRLPPATSTPSTMPVNKYISQSEWENYLCCIIPDFEKEQSATTGESIGSLFQTCHLSFREAAQQGRGRGSIKTQYIMRRKYLKSYSKQPKHSRLNRSMHNRDSQSTVSHLRTLQIYHVVRFQQWAFCLPIILLC